MRMNQDDKKFIDFCANAHTHTHSHAQSSTRRAHVIRACVCVCALACLCRFRFTLSPIQAAHSVDVFFFFSLPPSPGVIIRDVYVHVLSKYGSWLLVECTLMRCGAAAAAPRYVAQFSGLPNILCPIIHGGGGGAAGRVGNLRFFLGGKS